MLPHSQSVFVCCCFSSHCAVHCQKTRCSTLFRLCVWWFLWLSARRKKKRRETKGFSEGDFPCWRVDFPQTIKSSSEAFGIPTKSSAENESENCAIKGALSRVSPHTTATRRVCRKKVIIHRTQHTTVGTECEWMMSKESFWRVKVDDSSSLLFFPPAKLRLKVVSPLKLFFFSSGKERWWCWESSADEWDN